MSTVKLEHISKKYPNGFEAVKDFNLEIGDKEFIIFVGPSGCGKVHDPADGSRTGGDHRRRSLYRRKADERRGAQGPH